MAEREQRLEAERVSDRSDATARRAKPSDALRVSAKPYTGCPRASFRDCGRERRRRQVLRPAFRCRHCDPQCIRLPDLRRVIPLWRTYAAACRVSRPAFPPCVELLHRNGPLAEPPRFGFGVVALRGELARSPASCRRTTADTQKRTPDTPRRTDGRTDAGRPTTKKMPPVCISVRAVMHRMGRDAPCVKTCIFGLDYQLSCDPYSRNPSRNAAQGISAGKRAARFGRCCQKGSSKATGAAALCCSEIYRTHCSTNG